ncbi:hypothetical protein QE152_g39281 [Popillia japonica]|uniref:Peptidase A2 domain-containing protein n=1 Tax=Popillia japonica TaxID=7064 RepID=A0AAW1HUG9_POPJA
MFSTNERYFFDCSVNGKPLESYVDTGCSAILIKKHSAKELQLRYIPCELNITGYGGSMLKVLGKTNIHLKVDGAEAEVEALIVPNMEQEIPIMAGQTFLNNNKVVMLVFDGNVRLLSMDHDIGKSLNLATVKIPYSTVIAPNTTALVAVSSRVKFTGDLYVRGGLRPIVEEYLPLTWRLVQNPTWNLILTKSRPNIEVSSESDVESDTNEIEA